MNVHTTADADASRCRESVRVLGPVGVWVEDQHVAIDQRCQQELLALLAIRANTPVSPEHVLDELWGPSPPTTGVRVVTSYVHRLRQALESAHCDDVRVVREAAGYRLTAPVGAVDVLRVEELSLASAAARHDGRIDDALSLLVGIDEVWRGEPLSGLRSPFAQRERSRLRDLHLDILEQRFALLLQQGRHAEVMGELFRTSREHPTRERFAVQLMGALAGAGRQAEALQVFASTRRALVDELGIEPGRELCAVHEALLRGEDPWADSTGGTTETSTVRPAATARLAGRCELPPLLPLRGRDSEQADLLARGPLDHAARVDLVTGMPGVGKSAFATSVAHRCAENHPDGQLHLDLHGVETHPLGRADVLAALLRSLEVDRPPPTADERAALWRSLCRGRRLLIVLDDVREESQIRGVAPASSGCRLLVTSRSRLPGLEVTGVTVLEPLDATEAVRLFVDAAGLAQSARDDGRINALVERCAGVPQVVKVLASRLHRRPEVVATNLAAQMLDDEVARDRAGKAFRAVIQPWLAGLHRTELATLRAVASVGAAEGAYAPGPNAPSEHLRALDGLVDLNLLRPAAPGRYTMHPLTRRVVSQDTGESGRGHRGGIEQP